MSNLIPYLQILWQLHRQRPTLLSFNVSNRCNERCPMCNIWRTPAEELTLAEIERIFNDLKRLGLRVVEISGGEPFLREDLPEIIALLDRLGFFFTITTNGTVWRDDIVDALRRSKGLIQIAVSLDSLQPEVYARLRGANSLPQVLATIDRLIASRLPAPVKINFTMNRYNVRESFDILSFCRYKKIYMSVFPANIGNSRTHGAEAPSLLPDEEDRRNMAEVFLKLARLRRRGEPLWEFSNFYSLASGYILGRPLPECNAGRLYLDLHADGHLAPCLERSGVADLRREPVEEGWMRIKADSETVRTCVSDTPCCYTCTVNVAETARHPVHFVLETALVRLRMRLRGRS